MKKNKKKGKVISVDFTGVEGSIPLLPNGDYKVKVLGISEEEGDKAPYLQFKLEVIEGKQKGKKLFHICSLSKQSLWNLRATLEALGQEVPQSVLEIDTDDLKGLVMGVSTEQEKYKGRNRTKVVDVFSLEEMEEMEEPNEEPEDESGEEGESGEENEGEGEESETESSEEGEGGEEEDDELAKMSLKELLSLADQNDISIPKKDRLSKDKVLEAINAFLEE